MSRTSRWRTQLAAGEGLRTLLAGRWLSVMLVAMFSAGLAAVAITDAVLVQRLVDDERQWVAGGGRVLVATNDAGGVPSAACEGLRSRPGVITAAAVTRLSEPVTLGVAPEAAVAAITATEGAAALLGLEEFVTGVVLPSTIADTTGLEVGSHLLMTPAPQTVGVTVSGPTGARPAGGGPASAVPGAGPRPALLTATPLQVVGVADLSLLGEERSGGILLPVSADGAAEACFISVRPGYLSAARAALPAVLATNGTASVVSDRLVGGEFARDYVQEYLQRGSRHAPWMLAAGLGVLWLIIRWLRRGHDGLYATLGAGPVERTVIRMSEWTALVLVSVSLAGVAIAVAAVTMGLEAAVVLPHAARTTAITVGVATAIAAIAAAVPLRSPLDALKDR